MSKISKLGGIMIITIGIMEFSPSLGPTLAEESAFAPQSPSALSLIQGNSLMPNSSPFSPATKKKQITVVVTAYSSSPEETDDTPDITAFGTKTREGIVANNWLPFGTKIKLPEIYGNRVFTVEDRMNSRKGPYHIDIWFPGSMEALNFGVKLSRLEILES